MVIDVSVRFEGTLRVQASPQEAFELVADIPRSGMHFPGVASITPKGTSGCWHWQLKEKGIGPVKITASYDAVYRADAEGLQVQWSPPPGGGGDMESSGSWTIEADGEGALMQFSAHTVAHIPAPRLLGGVVETFAREEMLKLKREYLEAIGRTLRAS